jgi:hypothetical protein
MTAKPERRSGVDYRSLSGGIVAVNPTTNHAHALGPEAAAVWLACDGHRSLSELAAHTGLPPATVQAAVTSLDDNELLADAAPASFTRRAVLATGAGLGVALVTSIALPSAAMAASGGTGTPPPQQGSNPVTSQSPGSGSGPPSNLDVATASASSPASSSNSQLAFTGDNVGGEVAVGLGLLAAGGIAAAAARKDSPRLRESGESENA